MKKFVKGKWFPLVLAAVIAAILALILFLFGFRITYSPELDNNWDAVSACAAWVGAIGTVLAIFFAIRVANKQNKITLFEKRLEIFNTIISLKEFSDSLKNVEFELSNDAINESCKKNRIIIISHMNVCFGLNIDYREKKEYLYEIHRCIEELKRKVTSTHLLFSFYSSEKMKSDSQEVINTIENLIIGIFLLDEAKKMKKEPKIYTDPNACKQNFIKQMDDFYQQYYQVIEDKLNLNRW